MENHLIIEFDVLIGCDNSNIETVIIPEGVTTIANCAFNDYVYLRSVVFPSTLQTIGISAFENCEKLENLILNDGLLRIEEGAFYGCRNIKLISLPASLQYVGESAFSRCNNVKYIECNNNKIYSYVDKCLIENESDVISGFGNAIPSMSQIKCIRCDAFTGCSYPGLIVPPNIKYIESFAFNDCKFETIRIEHDVQIEKNAFYNCDEIVELVISNVCSSIERGAIEIPHNNMLNVYVDSLEFSDAIKNCVNFYRHLPDCTWVAPDLKSGSHLLYCSDQFLNSGGMYFPKPGFIYSGNVYDAYFIGYSYKEDCTLKVTLGFLENHAELETYNNNGENIIVERKIEITEAIVNGVDYAEEIIDEPFSFENTSQHFFSNVSMTFALNSKVLADKIKNTDKITLKFSVFDYIYESEEDAEENIYTKYIFVDSFKFDVLLENE